MLILSREEISSLANAGTSPCISLYMPAHRHIPDTEQDPIRFKNLLKDAEQQLDATGLRSTEVRGLLDPAHKLLDDVAFWKFQSDGLAVFISPVLFRYYKLPFKFTDILVVGDRFHLKPLLQVLANDKRYFILAVSRKRVRMLEATGYGTAEVRLDNVPENIGEILSRYDFEGQLQSHTHTRSSGSKRSAVFHGQGQGNEDDFKRVIEYLREVDTGLQDVIRNEKAPLVLAGETSLAALYKGINSYRHLVDEVITGNPDQLRDEELKEKSWGIVQPVLNSSMKEAREKFLRLIGTGKASDQLQTAVPAAFHGQIESIFVPAGVRKWGVFDQNNNAVALHESHEPMDSDLLDFAALHTWVNNGTVYVVDENEIPGTGILAAIHRF